MSDIKTISQLIQQKKISRNESPKWDSEDPFDLDIKTILLLSCTNNETPHTTQISCGFCSQAFCTLYCTQSC